MGGGAMLTPVAGGVRGGATTTNHHNHSSAAAPPPPPPPRNLPISSNWPNSTTVAPFRPNRTDKSSFPGETSTRIESIGGREDGGGAVGSFYDSVFRRVPSGSEVEKAISDLLGLMLGFGTSELFQQIYNPTMLKSPGYARVADAFRLLQTDPLVQRMVTSIASDERVWDAILNNKAVRNLRESICTAKEEMPQSSTTEEEPDLATLIVKWILDITKAKVVELIEQFISLVNSIFQPPDQKEKPAANQTTDDDQLDDKLRSSLLLSIVILLIVVVTRVYGA